MGATKLAKPAACPDSGYVFDVAFTSVLKRAIKTLGIAPIRWISCGFRSPELEAERASDGALQGLNKAETAAKHGEAQTKIWRRSRHSAAATDHRRRAPSVTTHATVG